ncbi:MAG: hypothetical protein CL897_04340 [Dehalococcoidia bacterium]|nr:hypothetical protein [Dehalococcoidia bacterium]
MVELWVPQRKLGGAFSVDECARRLMHYRYAEVEMMRALLQWIATQPQVHHKVEFGPMAYHCAQHADMLGKRLPELRVTEGAEGPYPLMISPKMDPPNDEFRVFMEALQDQEDSVLRVVGVFGVLKPHLATHYLYHMRATDQVVDSPTVRILKSILVDEEEHIQWGRAQIEELADTPKKRRLANEWRMHLEELLTGAGGVIGVHGSDDDE